MDENQVQELVAVAVKQALAQHGIVSGQGNLPNKFRKIAPVKDDLDIVGGVGYDQDINITLENGKEYYALELDTNIVEVSTIEEIIFEEGGDPQFYMSGKNLLLMDNFLKKHKETGRIIFELAHFEYATPQAQFQTKLVTLPNENWTVKIKVKAKHSSDPANLVIKASAWNQAYDPEIARMFLPLLTEKKQESLSDGKHEWTPYYGESAKDKWIQRLVFDESEVKISEILVKRGKTTIHTIKRASLDFWLQRKAGIALQSGKCLLDFAMLGYASRAGGAINCHKLNFELRVDTKGTIKTLVQGFEKV